MRTTDGFEPLDLRRLCELTVGAVAAAAADDQDATSDLLRQIESAGGAFAVTWALATSAVGAGVLAIDATGGAPGEPPPPIVTAAVALAGAVLGAATTGRVFDASATFLATPASVRSTALSVLVSVAGSLGAGSLDAGSA